MQFVSTRDRHVSVGFKEAVRRGLAPDGGLYVPKEIPRLSREFFSELPNMDLQQIGFAALREFTAAEIDDRVLQHILDASLTFPVPLVEVGRGIFALELFHGPTMAFKDIGAQCMGRMLPYCLSQEDDRDVTVLVATSGDTGSAVAHGFYRIPGIRVVVLYPEGGISQIQEMQIATLGENIHVVAVQGNFDDCQKLVKEAFLDEELNKLLLLTSANSINIGRWLPQILYYFLALNCSHEPVIAVPSGNFGNFTAGVLACRMGLPAKRLLAACNANRVVPHYLDSGDFQPIHAVRTLANAMDVGDPSNFERLQYLYDGDLNRMREEMTARSFSDDDILASIRECYDQTGYVLDPHGATAYQFLRDEKETGVFLATAHPGKFPEIYERLGIPVETPKELDALHGRPGISIALEANLDSLKSYLLNS